MGKKGQNTSVWKYYKVQDERIKKLKKECSRCGKGVFMGEHDETLPSLCKSLSGMRHYGVAWILRSNL